MLDGKLRLKLMDPEYPLVCQPIKLSLTGPGPFLAQYLCMRRLQWSLAIVAYGRKRIFVCYYRRKYTRIENEFAHTESGYAIIENATIGTPLYHYFCLV
jgi:hypothetical protein